MLYTTDLYLGAFLILCGFALSLFNLKRVVKGGTVFSSVLLSENIILLCIGVAFVSRSAYSLNPTSVNIIDMEERAIDLNSITSKEMTCGFPMLLLGYGPLIVSMVNSFLSLIIDNYMYYKILGSLQEKSDDNAVQELGEENVLKRNIKSNFWNIFKKYFSFVTIALQWIIPVLSALAMYPIKVKEISMSQARIIDASCMAMLNFHLDECVLSDAENYTIDLSKYIHSPVNFFESQDNEKTNNTKQINTVLSNVLHIINNFNNQTNYTYATIKSLRQPKTNENCMKMCYMDNKSLLTYMFIFGFVSYFIPITISTIILTKIHIMEVKKHRKLHVTSELLCNILFWTPVMFDTFLSLILCSYTTHGMRTSMFNVIANIYQAVKNFMNTKYFKENVIVPISVVN